MVRHFNHSLQGGLLYSRLNPQLAIAIFLVLSAILSVIVPLNWEPFGLWATMVVVGVVTGSIEASELRRCSFVCFNRKVLVNS